MKNKMNKIITFILYPLSFILSSAYAGEYAFDFLEIGVGGRECALGRASVSTPSSGFPQFSNPAGLAEEGFVFSFMHASPFSLSDLDCIGITMPLRNKFGMGLSVLRMGVSDISRFGEELGLDAEGKFGVSEILIQASGGMRKGNILLGLNLKWLKSRVDTVDGSGIGFDMGLMYKKGDFSSGLNIKDPFTSVVTYKSGNKDVLRRNIMAGISYSPKLGVFNLLISYDLHSQYELTHHIGIEMGFRDYAFMRFGIDDGNFAGGVGAKMKKLFVDYAFSSYTFKPVHRISGGISI